MNLPHQRRRIKSNLRPVKVTHIKDMLDAICANRDFFRFVTVQTRTFLTPKHFDELREKLWAELYHTLALKNA
jgi:chemotaxis methyl-accepting protein methylase